MLFNNESRDNPASHSNTIRDKLQRLTSRWTLLPVEGILRPAVGVVAYLVLCLLFQAIAPDFHLFPQEWSWNIAGGLSFGFLMAFGLAYIPVVFVAYLIPLYADGSTAVTMWPVIVFAVGNTTVFGSACYIARRVVNAAELDLEDRRTLVTFLVLIPFTALVAAFISTMNWWFGDVLLPGTFVGTFLIKTFGNGMGLLLAGPFVLLNGMPLLNKVVNRSNPGVLENGKLGQGAVLLHAAAGAVLAMSFIGMDRFEAYLLLSAPLIAMALRFQLRGLAASFLAVGCSKTVMAYYGYTALDGLFMETTILAALIGTLIVATLATERTRAMNTVQRQAALIVDALTHTNQETTRTPGQEIDLKEVLKPLAMKIEPAAIQNVENDKDDSPFEHQRLLERLEKLIHESDRRTENRLAMKDLRG